jgi:F0F1-type ATP synthase assembly protein I
MLSNTSGSLAKTAESSIDAQIKRPVAARGPSWRTDLLAAVLVAMVYFAAPTSAPSQSEIREAERRGASIQEVERLLGIDVEAGVQEVAAGLQLQWVANWLYGTLHFLVTAAVFVVLLRYRPARYQRWRTSFVVASVLAFTWQRLVPVAPPRLIPDGAGGTLLDDWLRLHASPWSFDSGLISEAASHYAAMPSMHVGWAVLSAAAIWHCCGRTGRSVAVAYPLLITVVVIATGNHFLFDAVGGAAVAVASLVAVKAAARLRSSRRSNRDISRASG